MGFSFNDNFYDGLAFVLFLLHISFTVCRSKNYIEFTILFMLLIHTVRHSSFLNEACFDVCLLLLFKSLLSNLLITLLLFIPRSQGLKVNVRDVNMIHAKVHYSNNSVTYNVSHFLCVPVCWHAFSLNQPLG